MSARRDLTAKAPIRVFWAVVIVIAVMAGFLWGANTVVRSANAQSEPEETIGDMTPAELVEFIVNVVIEILDKRDAASGGGYTAPEAPEGDTGGGYNIPMPGRSAEPCRLDKVGTFAEQFDTAGKYVGPLRIEVGGHGSQHVDYYPMPGVKAISFVLGGMLPEDVPAVWFGHGSIWEGDSEPCETYDYVKDAKAYAEARIDSGHSGLVIDMREGKINVVANVASYTEEQIDELLDTHVEGMNRKLDYTSVAPMGDESSATIECKATRDGDADDRTLTVPSGKTYVVEAWSPEEGTRVFVSGKSISGWKGALWVYPCGLEGTEADLTGQSKVYVVK